jgi:hypothetical protein
MALFVKGPRTTPPPATQLRWWTAGSNPPFGVVLAAFLVANSIHTVNYIADLRLGGHPADAWGLGALSLITAAALVARGRQINARESPAQVRSGPSNRPEVFGERRESEAMTVWCQTICTHSWRTCWTGSGEAKPGGDYLIGSILCASDSDERRRETPGKGVNR